MLGPCFPMRGLAYFPFPCESTVTMLCSAFPARKLATAKIYYPPCHHVCLHSMNSFPWREFCFHFIKLIIAFLCKSISNPLEKQALKIISLLGIINSR